MVFWMAILTGILFVWLALRLGFYETWILFFNIVISVYVSIFLAPLVAGLAPGAGKAASYVTALSMLLLAGGCFAVLQGLSYVFLTGQFSVAFPRFFDVLLSGGLGFFAGFLVLSFAALVVTTTPLAENKLVSSIGFSRQAEETNLSCLAWCCNQVHSVAGFETDPNAAQTAVDRLFETRPGPDQAVDSNEPPEAPNQNQKALPHQPTPRATRDSALDGTTP
jgi:hypothetical protein